MWAPSTAFVIRSREFQFGLNQLGVVEYQIDGDAVLAYFRAVPTLREEEPYAMVEFIATRDQIEAGLPA